MSQAAEWVRFKRRVPLDVAEDLPVSETHRLVSALVAAGWTADDIAHDVLFGIRDESIRSPAGLVFHRLKVLVEDETPPPSPPPTPAPARWDPAEARGAGSSRVGDWIARCRAAVRARP